MQTLRLSSLSSLGVVFVVSFLTGFVAQAGDEAAFVSDAARVARAPGSPTGPPPHIIICHRGHTISVAEAAVPAHLAHGDTLGPCPGDTVICHNGNNTLDVPNSAVPAHLSHGDTLGPCPKDVFMCNGLGHTIVVKASQIADHQARGHTLGLCPGKTLVCHKGKTIKVDDSAVPGHLGHGDSLGYCLGAQGPLIPTNGPPASAAHP